MKDHNEHCQKRKVMVLQNLTRDLDVKVQIWCWQILTFNFSPLKRFFILQIISKKRLISLNPNMIPNLKIQYSKYTIYQSIPKHSSTNSSWYILHHPLISFPVHCWRKSIKYQSQLRLVFRQWNMAFSKMPRLRNMFYNKTRTFRPWLSLHSPSNWWYFPSFLLH